MGEISEALERARQEESALRLDRRKRRTSEVADSLRQAAVDNVLEQEVASDPDPAKPDDVMSAFADHADESVAPPRTQRAPLELVPTEPSILSSPHQRVEQARHLANRVAGELERRGVHTLALVSAVRMEGKSTVSINLALATATLSQGRSVALVDLDLRRPTIASKLGIDVEVGLDSVLQGRADLEDICVQAAHPKLDIYPARPTDVPAHELLVLPRFAKTIQELSERYALVFFDTPPVLLVPDANLILKRVEACATVARSGVSRSRSVSQMLEMLPRDKVIGSLLNATSTSRQANKHYAYYSSETAPEGTE